MQILKRVKSKLNARVVFPCAAALIALVLIVLVCIFAGNATNMRNEYAMARNSLGEDLYRNLRLFTRSYDGVTLAGADVEGSILPSMRDYYLAGSHTGRRHRHRLRPTLSASGRNHARSHYQRFEAFDDAFAQGRSTGDAVSNMSACVQGVDQLLNTRYDAETRLLPA